MFMTEYGIKHIYISLKNFNYIPNLCFIPHYTHYNYIFNIPDIHWKIKFSEEFLRLLPTCLFSNDTTFFHHKSIIPPLLGQTQYRGRILG